MHENERTVFVIRMRSWYDKYCFLFWEKRENIKIPKI